MKTETPNQKEKETMKRINLYRSSQGPSRSAALGLREKEDGIHIRASENFDVSFLDQSKLENVADTWYVSQQSFEELKKLFLQNGWTDEYPR